MKITEVRVNLIENNSERLRAYCSLTLDGDFVIRDVRVIDGTEGPFVAMPSRKLTDRCPRCVSRNHLRARFCNECGNRLNENRPIRDPQGRIRLHTDIAHPINAECRQLIQDAVLAAYEEERTRAASGDDQPLKLDHEIEDSEDRGTVPEVEDAFAAPDMFDTRESGSREYRQDMHREGRTTARSQGREGFGAGIE